MFLIYWSPTQVEDILYALDKNSIQITVSYIFVQVNIMLDSKYFTPPSPPSDP